jgi:hypothetical protein
MTLAEALKDRIKPGICLALKNVNPKTRPEPRRKPVGGKTQYYVLRPINNADKLLLESPVLPTISLGRIEAANPPG